MSKDDGGPAFPEAGLSGLPNGEFIQSRPGMTLRDFFAAAALQNPAICTGIAADYEIAEIVGTDTPYRELPDAVRALASRSTRQARSDA